MSSGGNTATSTFIKQEPGLAVSIKHEPSTIKQERLSSFRLPRDLTLGGINPARITRNVVNKKVYTPNLNAIRNKNSDVKTSRDTSSVAGRGRGRGDRSKTESSRGARGGRGGKNSAVIQSAGLFSEGTGETRLRKSSSVFDRNNAGGGEGAGYLRRPTIVKREIKIDPDIERKSIQEILGEDEDDVTMDEESLLHGSFMPIALHEIKPEIKTELRTENNVHEEIPTVTQYPTDLNEFFSREYPQLFLLQLPDSLPGHGPDDEPAESEASEQNATNNDDPSARYCTVRQLEEGLLGKLVRYKSGKTKLVIGETRFDIDLGMEPGMLQEVMSVNTNAKERSGNLINLGQIQAKLSAIPDWEYIFKSRSSNS